MKPLKKSWTVATDLHDEGNDLDHVSVYPVSDVDQLIGELTLQLRNAHADCFERAQDLTRVQLRNNDLARDRDCLAEQVRKYEDRIKHVRKQLHCEGSSKPESCFIEELQQQLAAAETRVKELESWIDKGESPMLRAAREELAIVKDDNAALWDILRDLGLLVNQGQYQIIRDAEQKAKQALEGKQSHHG